MLKLDASFLSEKSCWSVRDQSQSISVSKGAVRALARHQIRDGATMMWKSVVKSISTQKEIVGDYFLDVIDNPFCLLKGKIEPRKIGLRAQFDNRTPLRETLRHLSKIYSCGLTDFGSGLRAYFGSTNKQQSLLQEQCVINQKGLVEHWGLRQRELGTN
jgi:hypothetical protein